MKWKTALLILLTLSAQAEPAFIGFLSDGAGGTIFAVTPSAGKSARWVKIGDTVDGYSVIEYRSIEEILVVKKDGQTLLLKLKTSKVGDGAASKAEAAEAAASFEELVSARKKLLSARERLQKLRDERKKQLANQDQKQQPEDRR